MAKKKNSNRNHRVKPVATSSVSHSLKQAAHDAPSLEDLKKEETVYGKTPDGTGEFCLFCRG